MPHGRGAMPHGRGAMPHGRGAMPHRGQFNYVYFFYVILSQSRRKFKQK